MARLRARGAVATALLAAGGAMACAPPLEPAHEEQLSASSTYAVVEIHPVRGEATSEAFQQAAPIRLRTLDFVPETPRGERFADEGDFPGPGCLTCRQIPGRFAFVRDLVSAYPLDSAWEPGEARRVRAPSLEFRNGTGTLLLAVRGTNQRPAEVEVRLVKRCRTPVFYREESTVVWGSGVIRVASGTERHHWVEIAPPCHDADDHHELVESPADVARREAARDSVQEAEAAARAALANDAFAHQEERFARYEREAARHFVPTGDHALNAAERLLNPRTAGLMAAAGIRRLEMVRRCRSYRTSQAPATIPRRTYCEGYEPVLRVVWDGGGSTWVDHPEDARWATAWRAATLFGGVLRIEPPVASDATALGQRMRLRESAPGSPAELAARVEEAVRFAARSLKRPGDPDGRALPAAAGWKRLLGPGQRSGDEGDWLDVTPD